MTTDTSFVEFPEYPRREWTPLQKMALGGPPQPSDFGVGSGRVDEAQAIANYAAGVNAYWRDYVAAAVLAERELWSLMEKHQITVAPSYIRDGSGRYRGWMACGRRGLFLVTGETPLEAMQECASAIRGSSPASQGEGE